MVVVVVAVVVVVVVVVVVDVVAGGVGLFAGVAALSVTVVELAVQAAEVVAVAAVRGGNVFDTARGVDLGDAAAGLGLDVRRAAAVGRVLAGDVDDAGIGCGAARVDGALGPRSLAGGLEGLEGLEGLGPV